MSARRRGEHLCHVASRVRSDTCGLFPWCRPRGLCMKVTQSCERDSLKVWSDCGFSVPQPASAHIQPSEHRSSSSFCTGLWVSSYQRGQSLGRSLSWVSSGWVCPLTTLLDYERQSRGCSASITGARVAVYLVYIYPQKQKWKVLPLSNQPQAFKKVISGMTQWHTVNLYSDNKRQDLGPSCRFILPSETKIVITFQSDLAWWGRVVEGCWKPARRRHRVFPDFFMSSFQNELNLGLMVRIINKGSDMSLALWEAGQLN